MPPVCQELAKKNKHFFFRYGKSRYFMGPVARQTHRPRSTHFKIYIDNGKRCASWKKYLLHCEQEIDINF
jgi:hypothetical protein